MIFCLLIAALLPAAVNLLRARQLTHVAFFSAGYIYYWVSPLLLGQIQLFDAGAENGFGSWVSFFQSAPPGQLAVYAVSILFYYFCFMFGDMVAKKVAIFSRKPTRQPSLAFVSVLYGCVFIISTFYIYHLRNLLGANYGDIGEEILSMGTLVAVNLVLLGLALIKCMQNEKATFLATISNRWMLGYLIVAFCQFMMGGRLYFVSFLLLLAGYRSVFFKRYTFTQLLAFVLGAALLGGAAGLLRIRAGFNAGALVLNLVAEPVFTSFSLFSFLSSNEIPWIEFPRYLAGDFLNLVPSAILGNKGDLLPDIAKVGFSFVNPLGAMSSWVSFIINFGLLGTAAAMAITGFFLRRLLTNATTPTVKTQYLMCSAFLVFTFFRDPFSVSLVKNFFEFGLLMPFLCTQASGWLAWTARSSSELIVSGRLGALDHP